jgi:5-methylcytosine-specific restriction endonuclease McrA
VCTDAQAALELLDASCFSGVSVRPSKWPTTSRQSRGYGAEWQHKRKRVLERDGYLCQCRHCKASDRTSLATEVDHVVSRVNAAKAGWSTERTEHEDNLQAINADCHARKTLEEQGCKVRLRIGLDGFPVEL